MSRSTKLKNKMATEVQEKNASSSSFKQPYFKLDAQCATDKPVETEVRGTIPEWLEGSLYRNGPGIYQLGDSKLRHLFDGFAILHRFDLRGGKVTYMSRVLDSETWQRSVKSNRLVTTQFGTFASPDPCKTIFSRMMSYFKPQITDMTDNASVNIVEHGDRIYAQTETPFMVRINPDTLLTDKKEELRRRIAVHLSTAHPHFDKEGNMYNLGTAFNPPNNYNIIKIPPVLASDTETDAVDGAQLLTSLQSRWKFTIGYNHSFGMSRDHFVILEQPVAMSSLKFLTNNWRRASIYENYTKHPTEELIFRVVRRSDNKEVDVKFCAEAAFTFHFVNCYEDEGHLVVDFVRHADLDIIDRLYMDRLDQGETDDNKPLFARYVLPLAVDKATKGENLVRLSDTTAMAILREDGSVFLTPDFITKEGARMELPRINYEKANAVKYRYAYGTSVFSPRPWLIKLDIKKKQVVTWEEENYMPGEPVFVAKPGATKEDEGVILSPVLPTQDHLPCYLLVLDAATFTEIGRAYTPPHVKMSVSFHGSYVTKGNK